TTRPLNTPCGVPEGSIQVPSIQLTSFASGIDCRSALGGCEMSGARVTLDEERPSTVLASRFDGTGAAGARVKNNAATPATATSAAAPATFVFIASTPTESGSGSGRASGTNNASHALR